MKALRRHFLHNKETSGPLPRSHPLAPRSIFTKKKDDLVLTPLGLRFLNRRFPCTIGRGGIVTCKAEGDGGTPVGAHRIVGILYRTDRMKAPNAWSLPIYPGDLWCDAIDHASYNQFVRAPLDASHEVMRRSDRLYDLVLITDWNWPNALPGKGSAIFLHRWRRPGAPTEGCVALRPDHLAWITRRLKPGSRLIVP